MADAAKPWLDEPGQVDENDAATGYAIALRRGPSGHWCGYVRVPENHPWHGLDYDQRRSVPESVSPPEFGILKLFVAPNDVVECHGGLTFAGSLQDRPSVEWWFGFDCCHLCDLVPNQKRIFQRQAIYRDVGFVLNECRRIAGDILRMENAHG